MPIYEAFKANDEEEKQQALNILRSIDFENNNYVCSSSDLI